MKNLKERASALRASHVNCYASCPMINQKECEGRFCAHYNPDTNECIHVEAAQARVRAVDILERAARAIEYLAECTTDPCIQPRRVLGVTRE